MAQHDMNIANQGFPATRADLNNALQALVSNSSGTSAPSTTFANQWWYDTTNNKMYIRNEADNAWIEVFTLDQTNNEWQLTTGVVQAKDSDGLALKTDDGTTRLFIKDSDGNIGIGVNASSPDTLLHLSSASGSTGAVARLESTDTSVGSGQQVGAIEFEANDASSGGSGISGSIKNISTNATGTSYGLTFSTGNASGGSLVLGERARIDFDGLKFNGDTAADNALDDYEEGDFAPTYSIASGSITTASNAGRYVKIGQLVFFTFRLRSSAASGTGVLSMTLPFATAAENRAGGSQGFARDWGSDMPNFRFYVQPSASTMIFYKNAMNTGSTGVTGSDVGTGSDDNVLEGSIVYKSAS